MAEFVEQGRGVIERDQHRLARSRLGKIIVVRHQFRPRAQQPRRVAIAGRPRARPFALARIGIEVEQPDHLVSLGVGHLEGADVGLPHRHRAGIFLELQVVQLLGRPEHAVDQVRKLEIGFDLVFGEVIFRLADLLLIITIIPRLDPRDAVLGRERLHVGDFLIDPLHRRRPDAHHQVHRPRRGLGHRVLHAKVGVGLVAEQVRPVGAQLDDLGDQRVGVVGIAIIAAIDERLPHLLAKPAIAGEAQHRIDRRTGVAHRERPGREILDLGDFGCGVAHVLRNPCHLGRAGLDKGPFIGEQAAVELGKGRGELLIDRADLTLLRRIELGAAADEAVIGAGQQAQLLGVEAEAVALVVERLDPGEQLGIERDAVERRRQFGRPFLVERLIGRGRHIVGHHAEHRPDLVEPRSAAFHRLDRVGEGRRGRIVRGRGRFTLELGDGESIGLVKLLGLDLVPRRNALVRPLPVGEQDVVRDRNRSGRRRRGRRTGLGGGGNADHRGTN